MTRASQRILIVDDEPTILFAMSEYLGVLGFGVDKAETLSEALALIAGDMHAAVIADLRLSGSSSHEGLQVIAAARQRSSQSCILLLSAFASEEVEQEALRLGANAVLRKPRPMADIAQSLFARLPQVH